MGDGGVSVGVAIHGSLSVGDKPKPMGSAHLGNHYSTQQIKQLLDSEYNLIIKEFSERELLADHCSDLLNQRRVLANFCGRMEFGPRALGNRSILANPQSVKITSDLNKRLQRSDFMPFAPILMEENAERLLLDYSDLHHCAEYMTCCYECTDEFKELAPAVVHVDQTARPQVVKKSGSPFLHYLLELFEKKSKCPALINTSFNLHETPIVESPADALEALRKGAVDYIIFNEAILVSLSIERN